MRGKTPEIRVLLSGRMKGSTVLTDMLPVVIAVIVTGMMVLWYGSWIANFEKKGFVDSLAREYVLRMASTGYLTPSDRSLLEGELRNEGIASVSFTGTTLSPVESGELVTLKMECDYEKKNVVFLGVFSWLADESASTWGRFHVEKRTTAIY